MEPNQSSLSHIPTLDIKWRDSTISEAKMNEQKALALAETFFPPPPAESAIPDDFIYPEPVLSPGSITEEQLLQSYANSAHSNHQDQMVSETLSLKNALKP